MSKEERESAKTDKMTDEDRTRCMKISNTLLDIFVLSCLVNGCCKKCCCKKCRTSDRSVIYTTLTFSFSWMYFIGAIFLVPYAAQMALNSLSTATAVAIFLKRDELELKHFRILTGIFAPIVIFMSAYAVWNMKDEIDEEAVDDTLSLFVCLYICCIYFLFMYFILFYYVVSFSLFLSFFCVFL